MLKVKHNQMLQKMYPTAHIHDKIQFIFGNCESTFVVDPNGEAVPLSDNNPTLNMNESNLIIRSNKYNKAIYNKPSNEETVVMNGVFRFDTPPLFGAGFSTTRTLVLINSSQFLLPIAILYRPAVAGPASLVGSAAFTKH